MAVGIYRLTDQNGKVVPLFVPRFSGSERLPGNTNRYDVFSATSELAEQFDHTATFFVNDQTQFDNLNAMGFTNIVLCSEHINDTWTFENGGYITFNTNSATYHYPESTQAGKRTILGRYDTPQTFVSDRSNPDWISGVAGYYGKLQSTGSTMDFGYYFTFNTYYPQNALTEESMHYTWDGNTPFQPDPYAQDPEGTTGKGGGTGTFDRTGDDIDFPGLPTRSATNTGFITLFNPSEGELRSLANYMWSNSLFDLDAWKKIFANPMDAILGLSIVPVAVPNGGSSEVTVGNISTGISMNKAGAQYVEVDCGTLNVEEYWGAYLDYDPYTKAELYLPYIGTHPIAVDDIMGKPVHVVYRVDILSGACCAFVKCGGSVLYSFVGQCSCSIPITGNDWTNVINGTLSIAASIGTMVATGGATAPMAAAAIASTAVNSFKPSIEKSGSMGGMGGMLGVQTPYLILTRPRQALPANQNAFTGYPSFITMPLGDCSGYTEIYAVHLENIPATEQELSEIENLLKGGVIL